MAFAFPKLSFPLFTRNVKGDYFYDITSEKGWGAWNGTNLEMAQKHPILTPALLFVSKLFSQADFYILNKKTGEKIYDHWILSLFKNPNYYQTQNDFLESAMFTMIASGKAVAYLKRTTGISEPSCIYLLNPDLIEFPENFVTPLAGANTNNKIQNNYIIYDRDHENLKIQIKDLLFLYDLPNCLTERNYFEVNSRIDGLKQTLINTSDSLLAKNIILKTNGKELISGGSQTDFPLNAEEKEELQRIFNMNYGLGRGRSRGMITKAKLTWQSLHIALRDLGLDESVKVDGNLIYTALHIPKDILSLEAKKTTYNNFKESMVSYIQNEMQSSLDAFIAPFQKLLSENNLKLMGSYEHLPIMQFILIERYDGVNKRATALKMLRESGLPDEVCLELCGFDKNTKLAKLEKPKENGTEQGNPKGTQAEGN